MATNRAASLNEEKPKERDRMHKLRKVAVVLVKSPYGVERPERVNHSESTTGGQRSESQNKRPLISEACLSRRFCYRAL